MKRIRARRSRSEKPTPRKIIEAEAEAVIPELPRLLDTRQAARALGVAAQTLMTWRCTKRYPLRFVKLGGKVRYFADDLVKFLESRAVTPAAVPKSRQSANQGSTTI